MFSDTIDGNPVAVLENNTIDLAWEHNIKKNDLIECIFTFHTKVNKGENFLDYFYKEGSQVNRTAPTDRGKQWYATSMSSPCNYGITKTSAELTDAGNYSTTLVFTNKSTIESPHKQVKVYSGEQNISLSLIFYTRSAIYRHCLLTHFKVIHYFC